MGFGNILLLLGGLGAFLFGMNYMGEGLELAAGPKMKELLEKLTRKPIFGFLVGTLVTVVIQSSSATTVMVMGFINAGIMDLAQATGVIFGANIGTTITSVLIALDVSAIAPACIIVGAVLMLYSKKQTMKYTGQVILGFGFLFQGLHTMSSSMAPLKDSEIFQKLIMNTENPLLGFLLGVIICTILQSSSAAVGILQTLALQGLLPLGIASFIVCGINVGSSTPPLLSALNARHNAQRAAVIYLLFNVIGAVLFIPLTLLTPLNAWIEGHIASGAFQISVYHILFKVVTGIILLPCVKWVVKLTYIIIPIEEHESEFRLKYIDKNMHGAAAVMALQIETEAARLADLVVENFSQSMNALLNNDTSKLPEIKQNKKLVDYLSNEITNYLATVNSQELSVRVSNSMNSAYRVVNDLGQIGNYITNIVNLTEDNAEHHVKYSDTALEELRMISDKVVRALGYSVNCYKNHGEISMEQLLDMLHNSKSALNSIAKAQTSHLERLRQNICSPEAGMNFLEILNYLPRIMAHASNIQRVTLSSDMQASLSVQEVTVGKEQQVI